MTATPDAMPHNVLSIVFDHCTPRDSGEDDDFHVPLLMYAAPPCDYKRRRRTSFKGDALNVRDIGSLGNPPLNHTHSLLAPTFLFATFNPSSSRDLGASLPLSPRLYPLLRALRVQDNTVPSHTPFAGRTAPQPEPG